MATKKTKKKKKKNAALNWHLTFSLHGMLISFHISNTRANHMGTKMSTPGYENAIWAEAWLKGYTHAYT